MHKIEIHEDVFNPVYFKWLNEYARTQIIFGGSASGKTYFVTCRAIFDILKGGRNYLVCRAVANSIRKSVFTQVLRNISEWNLAPFFKANITNGIITCANGYQFLFAGLDDTEKLKSIVPEKGAITDIWVEEATETKRSDIKELYKRQRGGDENVPKRLTMTFNPIVKSHWIYTDYFAPLGWADDQKEYHGDGLAILKTTYRDNEFITEQDRYDLEHESDPYYRDVYTLGKWGVLGNVIFKNWTVKDLSGMRKQFTNVRNGVDFGFSSNPAAFIQAHYDKNHKTIYIYNQLYETGLTNDILASRIKDDLGDGFVTCDSAEPKSISELCTFGIRAIGAEKGKDSVEHGIQWLQQQKIIVDKSCVDVINELMQYKWKEDKDGNSLPVPLDKNNHAIDALRYAFEMDMIESAKMSKVEPVDSVWKGLADETPPEKSRWKVM